MVLVRNNIENTISCEAFNLTKGRIYMPRVYLNPRHWVCKNNVLALMIFGIECALVASVTHEYDEEHSTKCLPDRQWISNSCEGVIVLYEWHFTTEDAMVGWHH